MGGLAVAARLARLRHDVTLLEQAPIVGGKLGTYTRDGFTFDTGPSLLTLPAVYRDLFARPGARSKTSLALTPVDPVARYRFPDGTLVDVPNASRRAVAATFGQAFGAVLLARTGAGSSIRAGRIWQATRGPFLESPLDGPRDLLRQARRIGDLRTIAPWATLRGLGRQYLRDPRLRMFLDRYATSHRLGSAPGARPLAVVPYVEQTFGAWYVPGGLRRLGGAAGALPGPRRARARMPRSSR